MLRVCEGKEAPQGAADLFGDSVVFLADPAMGSDLQHGELRERVEAALGAGGVAWVRRSGAVEALRCEVGEGVTSPLELPGGLTIPAGAPVQRTEAGELKIGGAGDLPELTLGLQGEGAGALHWTANGPLEASVRYFFSSPPGAVSSSFSALCFELLTAGAHPQEHRFDPARPLDPEASYARPADTRWRSSGLRTRWGATVLLAPHPPESRYVYAYDPSIENYYPTLSGLWRWKVEAKAGEAVELLPGTSGGEFVRVGKELLLRFVADGPAYATGFSGAEAAMADSSAFPLESSAPGCSEKVRTPWLYAEEAPAELVPPAEYVSQPEGAPMYGPASYDCFLHAFDVFPQRLPPGAKSPWASYGSFPFAPYGGLQSGSVLETVRRFEAQVLAPARTRAIRELQGGPVGLPEAAPSGPSGATASAVTPQGLASTFSPDRTRWEELVLARTAGGRQKLAYTNIRGKLQEALLATELFLVVTDVKKLYECCGSPDPNRIEIGGWTFDLSRALWATGKKPTILVIDFADGDFKTLVRDLSRWTLPGEFNAEAGKVAQERLLEIIEDAENREKKEPDLAPFVKTVLAKGDRPWQGVIYFDAAIPVNAFPPELEALAAGLPKGLELRAHHLGVSMSPFDVSRGQIRLGDSSLFGLILYEDESNLVFEGNSYDYKVLSLKVRFANSAIATFSSKVELLVGRLFGELVHLAEPGDYGPNNVVLDGSLEHGRYRFATSFVSRFEAESAVVDFVQIDHAELVTVTTETAGGKLHTRFVFDGTMGFKSLGEFDLFGYEALAFSNLLVEMEFDPANPAGTRTLEFVAGQMAIDPSLSSARETSLPQRFPLKPAAMREAAPAPPGPSGGAAPSKSAVPADLGFMPVESPLGTGELGPTWFGLELALNFGEPGGLAAKTGFSGALLASWAPSESGYDVAVGLRLPGSKGGSKSLTIMGPLSLAIGRLNFLYDPDTEGYLLLLQNMALSFLGLSFPPGGKATAALFGDPNPKAASTMLGWYAAYKKES